jgi:hypothetical protein
MDEHIKTDLARQSGQRSGMAANMAEQVGEKVGQATNAVRDYGRKTVESIDAHRAPAAETLDHAASALHRGAASAVGAVQSTADTLHTTAEYVRRHDAQAMLKDVGALVRRYPGAALSVAAVAGFPVARVFRTRG